MANHPNRSRFANDLATAVVTLRSGGSITYVLSAIRHKSGAVVADWSDPKGLRCHASLDGSVSGAIAAIESLKSHGGVASVSVTRSSAPLPDWLKA